MDELIKLVSEKTGLPEATARVAVETVLGFLKDRLPAPRLMKVAQASAHDWFRFCSAS